jgi:hypothetical protein
MAAINLKITTGPGVVKSFRFSIDQPIGELVKDIREKIGDESSGKDHALFQAGAKGRPPRWLKNNRTLKFYNINNGVRDLPFMHPSNSRDSILFRISAACPLRIPTDLFRLRSVEWKFDLRC